MAKDTTKTTAESLLPNGPEASGDEDFDFDDLRVNFSDEEAGSVGRSFEPVPTGKYHVVIAKVELRKVADTRKGNQGKPWYNITFNVESHRNEEFVNRKVFGGVMLFDGALYSWSQLAKAVGRGDLVDKSSPTYGQILKPDELLGEELIAIVQKKRDTWAYNKAKEAGEENPEVTYKNDITGYLPLASGTGASAPSSGGSLMPG